MKNHSGTFNYLLGLILFLNAFYWLHGFQFGVNNNQEELPLLYALSGIADYPRDDYVQYHINHYTQITPFLYLIHFLAKLFSIEHYHLLFLLLHVMVISGFFLITHSFLKKLVDPNPLITTLISVLLLITGRTFIPARRWLFTSIFDLELVVILLICWLIYLHIDKRFFAASILISILGILYPIYTIPLYPVLLISLYHELRDQNPRKMLFVAAGYMLIPTVYSIWLWSVSHQTEMMSFDASTIMEYVRAPWHYRIPSIDYVDEKSIGFFAFSIPVFFLSLKFMRSDYWVRSVRYFFVGILVTLILTSVIHSLVRIPLLIQISPYRIGIFAVFLGYLILADILLTQLNFKNFHKLRIPKPWAMAISIVLLFPLGYYFSGNLERKEFDTDQEEAMQWIRQNTPEEALILDYADLDVRTNCLRSSYWEFKTIPLTVDQQILWYQKYLWYNGYQEFVHPRVLSKGFTREQDVDIKYHGIRGKDKFEVLKVIPEKIDYLVTTSDDSVSYRSRNIIFYNDSFVILEADE